VQPFGAKQQLQPLSSFWSELPQVMYDTHKQLSGQAWLATTFFGLNTPSRVTPNNQYIYIINKLNTENKIKSMALNITSQIQKINK
jgi:hypothetical protein